MKRVVKISGFLPMLSWTSLLLLATGLFVPSMPRATAATVGRWATVLQAPPGSVSLEHILLLSDGTVMAQQAGASSAWFRLTPVNGSYINGTWTTLAPMNYTREFYSSAVLRDGRVFVAGGEYGTGGAKAEVYDPQNGPNGLWTEIPVPAGLICGSPGFSDSASVILPNGNVMIAPVQPCVGIVTVIYNPTLNSFSPGPAYLKNQNEATWVKLPDNSILTIDPSTNPNELNSSERYIPSLNNGQGGWIADANLTVPMYNAVQEIGAGLLLPDGRAFFIGGLGHTAYYTPTGNTTQGFWTQGPELISPGVGWDEPAAMMVNGKVLFQTVLGPPLNPQPRGYYEFDPTSNYPIGTITQSPDWGDTSGFMHRMLDLPDGNVLVSYGNSTLRIYIPDPGPVSSGKPTITSITTNADGSYHLTGTKLNGISQGSSLGDDSQADSNYPLVRLTDSGGNVRYGRTFNWSSTGVMTGNTPVTTEFTIPDVDLNGGATGPGIYYLEVVVNGISSNSIQIGGPIWVDFNYSGVERGSFAAPYRTLHAALDAALFLPVTGRTIHIKGPGSSLETFTASPISIPVTIISTGGSATVGH